MNMKKKMLVLSAAICAFVGFAPQGSKAVTVTNQGQVITITTLSEVAAGQTVVKDQSVYATPTDRRGLYVVNYEVPSGGLTGTVALTSALLPKGSILLEDAVIEVNTAVTPTNATVGLTVGGITVYTASTNLNTTGIKLGVATPGITTSADALDAVVAGATVTAGDFTVYIPYIMGNDQ